MSGDAAGNARVTIRIAGQSHSFEMERDGRMILDVARARDIRLPLHCHVGWCLKCRCRLVRGAVNMPQQIALTPEDRAAGIVLACCAKPQSDDVTLDFDGTGGA